MSSETRIKRYIHIFDKFYDVNKNGYIDKDDFKITANRLNDMRGYQPGQPEYEYIEKSLLNIFYGLLEEMDSNKDGRISLQEWIDVCERYSINPSKPPKWQVIYEDFVYEYLSNNTKFIKKDDYVNAYKSFGFTEESARESFDKISNGKSTISEAEFRQIWKEFFTSDDPAAPGSAAFCV